jgi:hypothetical protein
MENHGCPFPVAGARVAKSPPVRTLAKFINFGPTFVLLEVPTIVAENAQGLPPGSLECRREIKRGDHEGHSSRGCQRVLNPWRGDAESSADYACPHRNLSD